MSCGRMGKVFSDILVCDFRMTNSERLTNVLIGKAMRTSNFGDFLMGSQTGAHGNEKGRQQGRLR